MTIRSLRSGPFYGHLADAIDVNRRRRPIYAEMTAGRSLRLSRLMIWFERLSLPVAAWIDRHARPSNERAIGIVADSFVDMSRIRQPEAPLEWSRAAPEHELERVRRALDVCSRKVREALPAADFAGAAHAAMRCLREVEAAERETATHYAMSRHFAESVGLAAMRALDHGAGSGRDTTRLARRLLAVQRHALAFGIFFDRRAQRMHALGAGIVVNDVPDIPFHRAYDERFGSPP